MNGLVTSRTKLDYLSVFLINATIPAMLVWHYLHSDTGRGVVVTAGVISAVIANAAFLWGIKKRNTRHDTSTPRHVLFSCLLLAVGAVAATVAGVSQIASQSDLSTLALSDTPLSQIHPEEKRLFVGFLRIRQRNSQDYRRLAAAIRPLNPPLYSADSFADLEVIGRTSAAVHQIADADFSYAAKQQQAMHDFRDRMLRVNPQSEYLDVVASRSATEAAQTSLQHKWLASVDAVYSFAAEHSKGFRVVQAKLLFSNEAVRAQFAELLDDSEALHRKLLETVRAGLEQQQKKRSSTKTY